MTIPQHSQWSAATPACQTHAQLVMQARMFFNCRCLVRSDPSSARRRKMLQKRARLTDRDCSSTGIGNQTILVMRFIMRSAECLVESDFDEEQRLSYDISHRDPALGLQGFQVAGLACCLFGRKAAGSTAGIEPELNAQHECSGCDQHLAFTTCLSPVRITKESCAVSSSVALVSYHRLRDRIPRIF